MTDPLTANPMPEQGEELFKRLADVATGFGRGAVASAAVNLLINVVREQYEYSRDAERAMDELLGRAKHILLDQHYALGRRRQGLFPFTQTVIVPKVS